MVEQCRRSALHLQGGRVAHVVAHRVLESAEVMQQLMRQRYTLAQRSPPAPHARLWAARCTRPLLARWRKGRVYNQAHYHTSWREQRRQRVQTGGLAPLAVCAAVTLPKAWCKIDSGGAAARSAVAAVQHKDVYS